MRQRGRKLFQGQELTIPWIHSPLWHLNILKIISMPYKNTVVKTSGGRNGLKRNHCKEWVVSTFTFYSTLYHAAINSGVSLGYFLPPIRLLIFLPITLFTTLLMISRCIHLLYSITNLPSLHVLIFQCTLTPYLNLDNISVWYIWCSRSHHVF